MLAVTHEWPGQRHFGRQPAEWPGHWQPERQSGGLPSAANVVGMEAELCENLMTCVSSPTGCTIRLPAHTPLAPQQPQPRPHSQLFRPTPTHNTSSSTSHKGFGTVLRPSTLPRRTFLGGHHHKTHDPQRHVEGNVVDLDLPSARSVTYSSRWLSDAPPVRRRQATCGVCAAGGLA